MSREVTPEAQIRRGIPQAPPPIARPNRILRPALRLRPQPAPIPFNMRPIEPRIPTPSPPPPSPPHIDRGKSSVGSNKPEGSFKKGGTVKKTALYTVHKGEVVVPASRAKTIRKIMKKM